ncbi:MAG: hypothetical protein HKN94_15080 [Acidimicrobiales bacterium]|nr:hypothetical protein [Acidimicrobiales bacterium]
MPKKRRRREYLRLLDASKAAVELAVDCFNRVHNPYRNESTLILMTNAWEPLAKAVLGKNHKSIGRGKRGETIGPETAILRLENAKDLDRTQAATLQQVISLRHAATHHVLPPVPEEVMQHLLYFSCKFYRDLVEAEFPTQAQDLPGNFLSLSFSSLTTYADKVQKSVSKARRSPTDQRLVWLLERGVAFDGDAYLTEKQVAAKYKGKKKILPYLDVNKYLGESEMVRVVPVQAPKNFTADLTLRKGNASDSSLPVVVKKTDVDTDYPYLTRELGEQVGRNQNWAAKAAAVVKLKGDTRYHVEIRTSKSGSVQRYSQAAVEHLRSHLAANPDFNPYMA